MGVKNNEDAYILHLTSELLEAHAQLASQVAANRVTGMQVDSLQENLTSAQLAVVKVMKERDELRETSGRLGRTIARLSKSRKAKR